MIFLTAICIALVCALVAEKYFNAQREREHAKEREKLLQHIQAPQLAVLPEMEPAPFVAPDDDEGFWQAVEERTS